MAVAEHIDVVLITGVPEQEAALTAALERIPGVCARVRGAAGVRDALAVLTRGRADAVVAERGVAGPAELEALRAAARDAVTVVVSDRAAVGSDPLVLVRAGYEVVVSGDPDALALAVVSAITRRRAAGEAGRGGGDARFRQAFDGSPAGMALLSMDGRIEQANETFARLCGRTPGALTGAKLAGLIHRGDRDAFRRELRALGRGTHAPARLELRVAMAGRPVVHVAATGSRLAGDDGGSGCLLFAFENETERRTHEAQLRFLADHDPLTELFNRRRFEEEFARHLSHVARYGPEGALLLLDIDRFKSVNDTLGHRAGDELIVTVAGVLRGRMRRSDIVGRVGGDEFAVLLPKDGLEEAVGAAEAINAAIRACAELPSGGRMSASIGVVVFALGTDITVAENMAAADAAMYAAKAAGGDGHVVGGAIRGPVAPAAGPHPAEPPLDGGPAVIHEAV